MLLMENKHRKFFVMYVLKKMPKIYQNTFVGRPHPLGELKRSPDPLAAI